MNNFQFFLRQVRMKLRKEQNETFKIKIGRKTIRHSSVLSIIVCADNIGFENVDILLYKSFLSHVKYTLFFTTH